MKQQIDYSQFPVDERDAKAVADFREFLGDEITDELVEAIKAGEFKDEDELHFLCDMFLGVRGFAVAALWRANAPAAPNESQPQT